MYTEHVFQSRNKNILETPLWSSKRKTRNQLVTHAIVFLLRSRVAGGPSRIQAGSCNIALRLCLICPVSVILILFRSHTHHILFILVIMRELCDFQDAKIGLIQFCLSAPKTDMESNIQASDHVSGRLACFYLTILEIASWIWEMANRGDSPSRTTFIVRNIQKL